MRIRAIGALLLLTAAGRTLPLTAEQKRAPGPNPVATVNGKPITEEELRQASALELDKLEMQKLQADAAYARNRQLILKNNLNRLIEDRLLAAEAARLGFTTQELMAKEVDQKVKDPTPEEVNAFFEANKARIRGTKEQLSLQIQQYLKQQNIAKVKEAYLNMLKKDQNVSVSLEEIRYETATEGFPTRGPADAPVTIVEFSDFQCTYCKDFSVTLDRISKEYGKSVRLIYRQLPLSEIHPMAQKAAEASLCAFEQGKFWEMHDLMFQDQNALKAEDLKAKALKLGLGAEAFNSCLDSGRNAAKVARDIRDGARIGVTGTPAILVNGRFFSGVRPYEEVAAAVQEELAGKRSAPAKK